eukprot:2904597-Rhodomonas_salina.1
MPPSHEHSVPLPLLPPLPTLDTKPERMRPEMSTPVPNSSLPNSTPHPQYRNPNPQTLPSSNNSRKISAFTGSENSNGSTPDAYRRESSHTRTKTVVAKADSWPRGQVCGPPRVSHGRRVACFREGACV